jgi:hypothetical protein
VRPVLVLHGVGDRGEQDRFVARVARLQREVDVVRLIPVYWGDLAADTRFIEATLPDVRAEEVRGGGAPPGAPPPDPAVGLALLGRLDTAVLSDRGWQVIADAAAGSEVRSVGSAPPIREDIEEVWPELMWLPRVGDDELLRRTGEILAAFGAGPAAGGDEQLEVLGLGSRVQEALRRIDDLVGELVGQAGGRLNHRLRASWGPGLLGFVGDVLAYEHAAPTIRTLLWDVVEREAPGYGTAERPIGAIGHSLGGVILVDTAVGTDRPIHLDGLVTFGSQAPLFHAITPRSALVAPFEGEPVELPDTIRGRWVNLWEPLDLLAFAASRVFCLAGGRAPEDRMVPYRTSSGLWTHSAYWRMAELANAVRDVFDRPGGTHDRPR